MFTGTVRNLADVIFNDEISDLAGEKVIIFPDTAVYDREKGIQVKVMPMNQSLQSFNYRKPILLQHIRVTNHTRQAIINCAKK
jgi:hypothetical protein